MKYSRAFILCPSILLATVAAHASGPDVQYPAEVQGIWMTDDEEGRDQCERFVAAMANDEDAYAELVGAEVISPLMLHSYAEYGEGNFYQPDSVSVVGTNRWEISAKLGIDADPEGEDAGTAQFVLAMEDGILLWNLDTVNGTPVDSWDEHRYFRCGDVPEAMYAS